MTEPQKQIVQAT